MKIAYIVGARPNFVKMAPVIDEMRRREGMENIVIHTGQHYDSRLSGTIMSDLKMRQPQYNLGIGSGTHAQQTARIMENLEEVLIRDPCDLLVVPGDVNSTVAAALVGAKMGIPIAHIESGLRSHDRTMPEEVNRIVTDQLSDYLFLTCDDGYWNLSKEGRSPGDTYLVGNTMIDSLIALEDKFRNKEIEGGYLLVTLHRPALVDGPMLHEVVAELEKLQMPVIFPLHPRTHSKLSNEQLGSRKIQFMRPQGYVDFLALEANATAVLTDSGGVQEETTYLEVPCFTLRANTERPITGFNTLMGLNPHVIKDIPTLLEDKRHLGLRGRVPPLWDGLASQRVADVLEAIPCGS